LTVYAADWFSSSVFFFAFIALSASSLALMFYFLLVFHVITPLRQLSHFQMIFSRRLDYFFSSFH